MGGGTPGFVEFEGWLKFDITSLYRDWASGVATNYGVQLAIDTGYCANGNEFWVYSSDNTDATLRPKLAVESGFQLPVLTATAGAGGLNLSWNSFSNAIYQLEAATALTNWTTEGSPVLGRGGVTNVVVPATSAAQFFRLRVQ